MPFASERQRAYMYSQHPEIAERWTAEAKAKAKKHKKKPVYIKPWSQPKSEHGAKRKRKRVPVDNTSAGYEVTKGLALLGRQGAHGTMRPEGTIESRRGGPDAYQLAGGGVALAGVSRMSGTPGVLAYGESKTKSRTGRSAWRGLERARSGVIVPASDAVGRQLTKIKPVAEVSGAVPGKYKSLLMISGGLAMMRHKLPLNALNPMGWTE